MPRLLIIDTCADCPNFNNEYPEYHEFCSMLQRKIKLDYDPKKGSASGKYLIPEDCPLPKTE